MARATVTGYCWPQSVEAGQEAVLHLSSSGGRPVAVEVARVDADRTVVFSDPAVDTGEHEVPPDAASAGCDWPVALRRPVDEGCSGHAVLGGHTSPGGGTVVTPGSTDWAHGLAGRDPQVEQITRNILDRLAGPG